ncbi:ethanolamine ammonia-lyase [Xaviernesmea oryzae]|uniref:Ethanolamine ammonia-lyase small subunit n=1 Tax=Xaviernesmea oryzae TaxID=464029 RepID=A0A1Q9AQN9_9HYPH|nr:ethanolamine ammonia-lyase subunit EutC [Xaviernesmea oryzae]OLP57757.1 ethanolamine ammonia-lyase [Xaviernesmea oryzae]SEM06787.1 Ethanolamine ammonia-lyase light chain [Xaviernesmea oryzae]
MSTPTDPFERLRRLTRARVALGRAGDGLPTEALLAFQMAHAKARDAVHGRVNFDAVASALAPLESLGVKSGAVDRATYLRRPDLGRSLSPATETLPEGPFDLVIVVADGLSSVAVEHFAAEVVTRLKSLLPDLALGPIVLAEQGRVAIGDEIGARMGAGLVLVLIGERPGLSSADSLGAYLTFAPKPGTRDSARNCVSNIHAHGLSPAAAADKLTWLIREALRLKLTGVGLKEAAPGEMLAAEQGRPMLDHG